MGLNIDGASGSDAFKNNPDGVIYLKGNDKNPEEFDQRFRWAGPLAYFEEYDGNEWVMSSTLGGSISTDRFVIEKLNWSDTLGIFNKKDDVNHVIWKPTSLPNGYEFGNQLNKTYITSSGADDLKHSPDMGERYDAVFHTTDTTLGVGNHDFDVTNTSNNHFLLTHIVYEVIEPVQGRLTVYDPAQDKNIYHTMSDGEFQFTGGKNVMGYPVSYTPQDGYSVDYNAPMQETGLIAIPLSYEFHLNPQTSYTFIIEHSEGEIGAKTVGSFVVPLYHMVGREQGEETIATREYIDRTVRDVGDIKTSLRDSDHGGWVVMDGSSITSQQWSAIAGAGLSNTWINMGGNATTRPNLGNKVLGMNDGTLADGVTIGARTKSITSDMIPEHDHNITLNDHTGDSGSNGSHTHTTPESSATVTNALPPQTVLTTESGYNWGRYGITDGGNEAYVAGRSDNDHFIQATLQHDHGVTVGEMTTDEQANHTHTINHNHTVSTTALTSTEKLNVVQPTVMLYHFMYVGA